jgi:hypothetical protein
MSPVMASFTPLRYPIPKPTAQLAAAQPKITRQIRAASSAQTIRASAERNHVIYRPHKDPITNCPASRAGAVGADRFRGLRLPSKESIALRVSQSTWLGVRAIFTETAVIPPRAASNGGIVCISASMASPGRQMCIAKISAT